MLLFEPPQSVNHVQFIKIYFIPNKNGVEVEKHPECGCKVPVRLIIRISFPERDAECGKRHWGYSPLVSFPVTAEESKEPKKEHTFVVFCVCDVTRLQPDL